MQMDAAEAVKRLDGLTFFDPEKDHKEADEILCRLLESMGCQEVAATFRDLARGFWYA
jgi:hypothetical protein